MPSMKWVGLKWHITTDSLPMLAFLLLLLNGIWLIVYLVLIIAVTNPAECPLGETRSFIHYVAMWGLLVFLAANVLTSTLVIILGVQGTPLTPSRRHLLPYILYWDMFKYAAFVAFLAWGLSHTVNSDNGCWTEARKKDLEILYWCTITVVVAVFLIVVFGYNVMGTWSPQRRWRVRLKLISRLLGCHHTFTNAQIGPLNVYSQDQEGRESISAAEIIGNNLARLYSSTDLEKSDILAGAVLTAVAQAQRRRALAAQSLELKGMELSAQGRQALDQGLSYDLIPETGSNDNAATFSMGEETAVIVMEAKNDNAADFDTYFWKWIRTVSRGTGSFLIPPRHCDQLVKDSLDCSARVRGPPGVDIGSYAVGNANYVEKGILENAKHWAKYAAAAYGAQTFITNEQKFGNKSAMVASFKLFFLTVSKRLHLGRLPEPARSAVKKRSKFLRNLVGGQQVAGIDDDDILYASYVNQPLGITPYFIVLDRPQRAVVLSVRGTVSFSDLITDLVSVHQSFSDWLPQEFVEKYGLRGENEAQAHGGLLAASKAVLEDLNRNEILHTLLMGRPREVDSQHNRKKLHQGHGYRTAQEYYELLSDRGIDCRGWSLILVGHSLGAAVIALLAPHFHTWVPKGMQAFAFSPPGGLVSRRAAMALNSLVTSVIIAKDSISRLSMMSFDRLQDEMLLSLSRTKCSKTTVLLRLRSKKLRSLPPSEIFQRLHEIPEEALDYLKQYFKFKCAYYNKMVPMIPPGRCILLRRVDDQSSNNKAWTAVWVNSQSIINEGILWSRHQVTDHYTQRLMECLSAVVAPTLSQTTKISSVGSNLRSEENLFSAGNIV